MVGSDLPQVVIRHPGSANVVKRVCDDIGLADVINDAISGDPDAWKLSPGEHITALVTNVLSTQRPLYRVKEDLDRRDVQTLFGPTVSSSDLNDKALGRALERIAECDLAKVFTTISWNAAVKEGIDITRLHADTTTLSVQGMYESDGKPVNVTHGYSTDKRPDLKQILFGLMVNQEGFPVAADTADGNLAPKTWQLTGVVLAGALANHLGDDWIYVADSALVTKQNLRRANEYGLKFISRIPDTFSLPDTLRDYVWERGEWEEIGRLSEDEDGAHYKLCSVQETLDGETYRFVVVQSSELDRRKARHLEKTIEKERKAMEKALATLSKQTFHCEPDAQEALAEFEAKWSDSLNRPALCVKAKSKRKPGRPPKNRPAPTRTYYVIEGSIEPPSEDVLLDLRQKMSCFVLITNVLDSQELSNEQVLRDYKGQVRVEQRFRFLKDPVFIDSVFLKNQDRVYALGFVFLFALLVASLIELKVRRALRRRGEAIAVPGGRITDRPTIRAIFDILNDNLLVALMGTHAGVQRQISADLDSRIPHILELLGYDMSLYVGSD